MPELVLVVTRELELLGLVTPALDEDESVLYEGKSALDEVLNENVTASAVTPPWLDPNTSMPRDVIPVDAAFIEAIVRVFGVPGLQAGGVRSHPMLSLLSSLPKPIFRRCEYTTSERESNTMAVGSWFE